MEGTFRNLITRGKDAFLILLMRAFKLLVLLPMGAGRGRNGPGVVVNGGEFGLCGETEI